VEIDEMRHRLKTHIKKQRVRTGRRNTTKQMMFRERDGRIGGLENNNYSLLLFLKLGSI
jgi:hypothetical protein